jgi:phenylpropionate dioxygenase-like ring-hydroxylating dioxygenase large terminal subunit
MNRPYVVSKQDVAPPPNDWDRSGLPAWAYTSHGLLDLERDILFRRHWQLAGHVGNVPEPGDYFCFDVAGERAIILRDKAGDIRVFHNVCRHRGSRVVAEEAGSCGSALVCPFHGWSYNLDGTLRSVPQPRSLPPLAPDEYGLLPVEFEIWHGLVFVRFLPGPQPSVAELMARHEREVAPYRIAEMVPTAPFWTDRIDANWKCVRDVDNEGYHVAVAHPGLQDLYGQSYFDEAWHDGTSRSFASFDDKEARLWSVRNYKAMLPEVTHLPESHRTAWLYIGLFPNAVLAFYPESVAFYQEFPLALDTTLQRGGDYVLPGETRQLKIARYLSDRINRDTGREDIQLTVWSNEAAHSSGYQGIILSDLEYGVRNYHDQLRAVMPVLNEAVEPAPGTLADLNAEKL